MKNKLSLTIQPWHWQAILVVLFCVSVLIRWYRIPDTLFFGFEQGRDAQIIRNISTLRDFVLVGPKTDIAGIFHGAWYYYIMVVPYLIGQGNPLISVFFLIVISSLVSPLMAILLADITRSRRWGVVAGVLSAGSFELISYSQWLSNVTLAIPTMAICLIAIWKLHQTQKDKYWLLIVVTAALAAQFEIILMLWFVPFFVSLLVLKQIKWPKPMTVAGIAGILLVIFAPMILFNLRNDFVSFKAIQNYSSQQAEAELISLFSSILTYGQLLERLVIKTLWYLPSGLVMLLTFILIWAVSQGSRQPRIRSAAIIFGLWSIMSWPVIFFPHSLRLTQLYVGSSLGLIGLVTLAGYYFSQLKLGKIVIAGLIGFWFVSFGRTVYLLHTNQDVFYRTIQDDLNYQDQRALLSYVHQDSNGAPYRLKAFTIPYYQEEGWQYLHQYFHPQVSEVGAQVIYVVIEEKVDPYWTERWIGELGPTELLEEKTFGRLTVQKRGIR